MPSVRHVDGPWLNPADALLEARLRWVQTRHLVTCPEHLKSSREGFKYI